MSEEFFSPEEFAIESAIFNQMGEDEDDLDPKSPSDDETESDEGDSNEEGSPM